MATARPPGAARWSLPQVMAAASFKLAVADWQWQHWRRLLCCCRPWGRATDFAQAGESLLTTLEEILGKFSFWFPFCGVTKCAETPTERKQGATSSAGFGSQLGELGAFEARTFNLYFLKHNAMLWLERLVETVENNRTLSNINKALYPT